MNWASWLFLVASLWGAWFAFNALVPRRRGVYLSIWSFVAGKTSIRELMGILRRCAVLVTNDTGPMHMAQALGVPVVAIFGPTDPDATRPSGGGQSVIRTDVRCTPCLLRACPIDHRCMTGISTDQVMTAVMRHIHGFSVLSQSSEQVG